MSSNVAQSIERPSSSSRIIPSTPTPRPSLSSDEGHIKGLIGGTIGRRMPHTTNPHRLKDHSPIWKAWWQLWCHQSRVSLSNGSAIIAIRSLLLKGIDQQRTVVVTCAESIRLASILSQMRRKRNRRRMNNRESWVIDSRASSFDRIFSLVYHCRCRDIPQAASSMDYIVTDPGFSCATDRL